MCGVAVNREVFVTLFDRNYLHHGLALYRSLIANLDFPFSLYALCVDQPSFNAISQLGLEDFKPISLEAVETDELRLAKASRTAQEYCWTLTPFTFDFVFNLEPNAEQVTYLDSDLWLRDNCRIIFDEFYRSSKHALITKHAYHPDYDQTATAGKFCVQFLIFKRHGSIAIRQSWQQQCLDWCFARHENGKFGDQKYLDGWPKSFPDLVHVLSAESAIMGPWNAKRFPYSDAVAWHFHGVRINPSDQDDARVTMNNVYTIPDPTNTNVYQPYASELLACYNFFRSNFEGIYGKKT